MPKSKERLHSAHLLAWSWTHLPLNIKCSITVSQNRRTGKDSRSFRSSYFHGWIPSITSLITFSLNFFMTVNLALFNASGKNKCILLNFRVLPPCIIIVVFSTVNPTHFTGTTDVSLIYVAYKGEKVPWVTWKAFVSIYWSTNIALFPKRILKWLKAPGCNGIIKIEIEIQSPEKRFLIQRLVQLLTLKLNVAMGFLQVSTKKKKKEKKEISSGLYSSPFLIEKSTLIPL